MSRPDDIDPAIAAAVERHNARWKRDQAFAERLKMVPSLSDGEIASLAEEYRERARERRESGLGRQVERQFAATLERRHPGTRWRPIRQGENVPPGAPVRRLVSPDQARESWDRLYGPGIFDRLAEFGAFDGDRS